MTLLGNEKIEVIINSSEDDKLSLLRDNNFISEVNSDCLELILNNISFTYVLSFLQNKDILNKIKKIDVKFTSKDHIFFKDYLEQIDLVNKSSSTMIKNMLINLAKDDVLNYLNKDYIINNLSNNDIIELAASKNINLNKDFNYINKLNNDEIITYINKAFCNKVDYDLIKNDYVKKLLPINIDLDELIYLYDLFTTKANQRIKDINHSFYSFNSLAKAYDLLGLNECINLSHEDITLNNVTDVFKDIDIDKLKNNKKAFTFFKNNYISFLKYKYPLSLSFGDIINNYTSEYKKYDNVFDIEKYLINNNIFNKDKINSIKYTINNNIAYLQDNKNYTLETIKIIANDLLNNNINYVILETKRDIEGIRLSSEKILVAKNKDLQDLFISNIKTK